jgi:apolipoprotein D and lipocalin family protein
MKTLSIISLILLITACASKKEPLKLVDSVDIPKFMGQWYVIANIPTFIEKDGTHGKETYTWNEKENRIDVMFTQIKDGKKKEYPQKAFVDNKAGNKWKIQFIWPLKFDYLVVDLAKDYSWTVVGVPDRDHVWIMAREKTMDETTYAEIVKRLKAQEFDVSKIEKVKQD